MTSLMYANRCCNLRIRKTCSSERLANFVRDEYVVCNNIYFLIRNMLEVANTTDSRRSIAKCDASQDREFENV